MSGKVFRSTLSVGTAPANPTLDTALLFDSKYREPKGSPIDEFQRRLHVINRSAPKPTSFDPFVGQLILLGTIAAVESFFRTIFRRLIVIDPICQESVQKRDVSFGAALHLSKELLPEAILERMSFLSLDTIQNGMKELLAVKGALPVEVEAAIKDYVRICHLRHCAVHRFGKLGAGNAIFLGLAAHRELLEKPLTLDYASLQSAIAISAGLVKTINNFLFNAMISRLPSSCWTGIYKNDRPKFICYYSLFAEKVSITPSAPAKPLYLQFIKQRTAFFASGR